MRKNLAFLISSLLLLTLSACGYQGGYRYACQDSANWDNPECNPPICEPNGNCSKDLIGEKAWQDYQASKGKK